jgi:AcrR family transcriptional regulator
MYRISIQTPDSCFFRSHPGRAMEPTEGPRPPRQERSRRTLRNLERAALDLVARDGADAVTVAAVVARARSSVGSFYARFEGKEELFRHLEARLWEDALGRWRSMRLAADDDGDAPLAVLEATTGFLARFEARDGALRRSLAARGVASEARDRFLRGLTDDVVGAMDPGVRSERVALGLRMVMAVLDALGGGVDGRAGDGGAPVPPEAVEQDLVRILAAVLSDGGEARGITNQSLESDTIDAVDPFDVWG